MGRVASDTRSPTKSEFCGKVDFEKTQNGIATIGDPNAKILSIKKMTQYALGMSVHN